MTADVDRLSRAQKVALTTGADYWSTADTSPVGPGAVRMADGPHGLRVQDDDNPDHLGLGRSEPATCFPPAVTLASSWDPDLIRAVGQALGVEARAAGVGMVLGPGMNIKRSPLCGRNFEYFSEDPLLTAVIAAAYVEGLQSTGVAACVKHFAVNNQETDRQRVSADVDERVLQEIYLRAFRRVIATAKPWAVMSSYNRVNGVFASENSWLLTEILRDQWGFDGVVVSDWGAVHDPVEALQAGLDVRMPGRPDDPRVADAVAAGVLQEAVLDRTARRIGLLADRTHRPEPAGAVDVDAHHELTRRAAAESAVLLKNDGAVLPLGTTGAGSIAVLGELAGEPRYQGAGSSAVNARQVVSGLEAFRRRFGEDAVRFAAGYSLAGGSGGDDLRRAAVDLAAGVDTVVAFLGLPAESEAEGRDRVEIDLPPDQVALLEAVAGVNRRVVVVLVNGSVVTTAPWRDSAAAILEVWLTGQAHGDSVVDVLTGAVNPSGKLAETVPIRLRDTPTFLDFPGENGHVRYGEGIFVGYRYYDTRDVDVDYPFGHGLSYTAFDYSDLAVVARDIDDPVALTVSVTVTNTGDRAGAEVVQVYVGDRSGAAVVPVRELRAFQKTSALRPGEAARVVLAVQREDLKRFDTGLGCWVDTGGPALVEVGSSSRDVRLTRETLIAAPPVVRPLTVWSTLRDWQGDVDGGPRLQQLIESRGGVRGRMGDLLASGTGRDSVLNNPLASLLEFPGFPVSHDDIPGLLPR